MFIFLHLFSVISLVPAHEEVTLTFEKGKTSAQKVDLCSIVSCTHDVVCRHTKNPIYICAPGKQEGRPRCPDWGWVIANSGANWGYRRNIMGRRRGFGQGYHLTLFDRLTVEKLPPPDDCYRYCHEELDSHSPASLRYPKRCNPLLISLQYPNTLDSDTYVVGIYTDGPDPLGRLTITLTDPDSQSENIRDPTFHTEGPDDVSSEQQVVEIETEGTDTNLWLEWMTWTVSNLHAKDCLACSPPRPILGTVPLEGGQNSRCISLMFMIPWVDTNHNCSAMFSRYGVAQRAMVPPPFQHLSGNYSCYTRTQPNGKKVGNLTQCSTTTRVDDLLSKMKVARLDIWWYCGTKILRSILPRDWTGTCAPVQLVMPFVLIPMTSIPNWPKLKPMTPPSHRQKRDTTPQGSFDNTVWIDAIGIPRGVPDEFKARNMIAAGLESLLLLVSPNKNAEWINYLYYNQQRFVNYTRDAIKGLAEQLHATSLMAWQNRLALDMILAERGGTCKLIGGVCCVHIPSNTFPNGSVTRALNGLTALSHELAEHSGLDDPFGTWLNSRFGAWKHLILSIGSALFTGLLMFLLCGWCIVPCLRLLITRTLSNMFSSSDGAVQMVVRQPAVPSIDLYISESDL